MITVIRKSFQTRAYKIFLWLVIFALAGIFSIPQLVKDIGGGEWIAKINGNNVAYSDFIFRAQAREASIQILRKQYGQFADLLLQSMGIAADPKVFALESLIRDELLNEVVAKLGLKLHPNIIGEKLSSALFVQQELLDLVPAFALDPHTGINWEILRDFLKRSHISLSDFDNKVEAVLERKLLTTLVQNSAYAPQFLLKEQFVADYLGKKFSVLHFNFADFVALEKKNALSQEELKAFYDKHAKNYFVAEKRAGKVWSFDAGTYGLHIDNDAIEAYYNDYKKSKFVEKPLQMQVRHILFKTDKNNHEAIAKIYEKAQSVRQELIGNPASFAQKAQELSDDKDTAKKGGLMASFAQGTHAKAFDRAAFTLKEDGDISQVVETEEGFEILQRVAKELPTYKPLNKVKSEIEQLLLTSKFKEAFARDVQALTSSDIIDEALVASLIKKAQKSESAALQEKTESLVSQALFRVSNEGRYAFYTEGNKGYLVQITSIKPRNLPSLETIKDIVSQDIYEQKAVDSLSKALKAAKEEAKTKTFAQLKDSYKATLEQVASIKGTDEERIKELRKKGLPIEKMLRLTVVGAVAQAMPELDGYLVRLDAVEPFNEQDFTAKESDIKTKLQTDLSNLVLEGFVASLSRNATIKINEQLAQAS